MMTLRLNWGTQVVRIEAGCTCLILCFYVSGAEPPSSATKVLFSVIV